MIGALSMYTECAVPVPILLAVYLCVGMVSECLETMFFGTDGILGMVPVYLTSASPLGPIFTVSAPAPFKNSEGMSSTPSGLGFSPIVSSSF